jgi:nucleoside-diphosphate-sugar epimerase
MRILVTGSAGRVGRAIAVRLMHEHEVVGLDRTPASTVDVTADLGDEAALARALAGCDAVVHAAALHAPHVGVLPDSEFQRVNIDATEALLEAAARAHVRRIVYTSSTAVFGSAATPAGRAGWVDEALAPAPETIYHSSKLAAEDLLRAAAAGGGPEVRVLRMSRCFPEAAPIMAAYRLHRGIDARDVAEAHARALVHSGRVHETWIVSGLTPFRREECAVLLRDAVSVLRLRAPELVSAFAARGWTLPRSIDRVYDASLAMRELGWQPRHGVASLLALYDSGSAEVLPPSARGAGDD